ncbi:MAG: preprotein translocase subunit YajC [Gaiellaceae bacterium]|nr:preprotein translocase subunit YajC [Gaiellaceae bacterium]
MNSPGFLILIVAFGFLWFVLIRPQKRRQVEAARILNSVEVGSQVLTAGGIYGEVTEVHDDDVMVRIAPELEVRVARKAIGAVIPPAEPDAEPDPEPDGAPPPEHDG